MKNMTMRGGKTINIRSFSLKIATQVKSVRIQQSHNKIHALNFLLPFYFNFISQYTFNFLSALFLVLLINSETVESPRYSARSRVVAFEQKGVDLVTNFPIGQSSAVFILQLRLVSNRGKWKSIGNFKHKKVELNITRVSSKMSRKSRLFPFSWRISVIFCRLSEVKASSSTLRSCRREAFRSCITFKKKLEKLWPHSFVCECVCVCKENF